MEEYQQRSHQQGQVESIADMKKFIGKTTPVCDYNRPQVTGIRRGVGVLIASNSVKSTALVFGEESKADSIAHKSCI